MTTDTGVQPTDTIAKAKEILRPKLKEGFICPCCNQPAKLYRRPLTSSMAYAIILMYHRTNNKLWMEWIHVEDMLKALNIPSSVRGDFPKLRFWGLIEAKSGEREDSNPNNGYYKITEAGRLFLENKATVDSHVWLYNNKAFEVNDKTIKQITIVQALKNKFNYENLMNGTI